MSKAKNTPRRRGKAGTVKGAVLIMILAVMVVLIIMLAGAMAIASTAGNRAINKYEESQAYYSARSGLDLVTNILMTDAVHKDKNDSNDGDNSKAANTINASNPSQGLVLQEAIVGKLVTDASGNVKYDTSKSLTVAPTDASGKIKENDVKTKTSYMKFDVKDMNTANDGTSGLFSDQKDGSIEVKIQLLELVYDDGNTGIERNTVTSTTAVLNNGDEKAQYIKSCKIKVSCTAEYLGNSSTVSVVLSPYVNNKTASEGVVSTGALKMSTNSNILGGASSAKEFSWGNDGTSAGSVYVNGSTQLQAQKVYILGSADSICINGDFRFTNNFVVLSGSDGDAPFVFVNGTLKTDNSSQFGNSSSNEPVDLIVKNLDMGNYPVAVYGDTYVDGYLKWDTNAINLKSNASPTSLACFDGNLFVSDSRKGIVASVAGNGLTGDCYNINNMYNMEKTSLGVVQSYQINGVELQINMRDINNGGNKLMGNIISYSGNGFCTGDIYYYFEEKIISPTDPHEYYGCVELEAVRRLIANLQSADTTGDITSVPYPNVPIDNTMLGVYQGNRTNFNNFFSKLHPTSPNGMNNNHLTMKYIIQPAMDGNTPAFVDKMTFSPAYGGSFSLSQIGDAANNERPTYLLNVSLPYWDGSSLSRSVVNGTGKSKAKQVPTLLSKYADYYFLNTINSATGAKWLPSAMDYAFLKMNTGGNPPTEIVNFVYNDSFQNGGQGAQVTRNWKTVLGDVATDVFAMKTDPTYNDALAGKSPADLVTRAWDVLNALYEVDTQTPPKATTTKNVSFVSPALNAHEENNINFSDYSTVGSVTQDLNPSMTVQPMTPSMLSNKTETINTDSGEVILVLEPGTYQNGKLLISGANYCYIMLPISNPLASEWARTYQFWNFSILSEGYYQDAKVNNINNMKVGSGGIAGYTKIKSPKIMFYVDDGAVINAYNGGDTTIMGYMYGPSAKLTSNTKCSTSKNICYEGSVVNNFSMDFVGSAFVGDVDVQNGYSFLYVPPVDEADPGTPTITWRPSYYTNQDIVEFSS